MWGTLKGLVGLQGWDTFKQFLGNANYRPSLRSMGMSEPTDPVDEAIQLAASGYGSEGGICEALADSSVFLTPESTHGLGEYSGVENARRVLDVFTDARHAPSEVPELRKIDTSRLMASLPIGTYLKLNPGSSASVEIPVADLLR